jgi:hypothetical protein
MLPEIHIYSRMDLDGRSRGDLEEDIYAHFQAELEVTGGGEGQDGWNIDLQLASEDACMEPLVSSLVAFLRRWSVPPDTILNVFSSDWSEGQSPARVNVYGQ